MLQIKDDFERLIEKLEILSIRNQLFGKVVKNEVNLTEREVSKLLSYASILSLSEDSSDISQSYEIITRLLEIYKSENYYVIKGAEILLSRIGNFPGRNLLRERYFTEQQTQISPVLMLECLTREVENSLYQFQDKITLTDFQYKLFDSLESQTSLSVSAPTSAGKSFVLNLDLVRKIREREKQSIIYIVPTRALISEVSQRIRTTLRAEGLSEVMIRTAPFPVAKENIKKAVIYVLTQERLMSLINCSETNPFVTSLIVDEAHEIQKGKRGIVLQNAIDITLAKFPNTDVLFASPLIKNPGYFLSLFDRNSSGEYFVETISPVSQNIILVSEVKCKPKCLDISIITRNKVVEIGHMDITFNFRHHKDIQKASLALSISLDNTSVIVFSNGPADAENVAEEIAKIKDNFKVTKNIKNFIEFIKKDIHPEYPLINCLENGVAFHYGRMPSLVRSGIERLFKDGEIKLICCTSTLLQGVNLPAKHIIIENPKSGDDPMSRSDFLNLAGRAGRLLKEFHGNIWCIRPSSWKEECYKGEPLQEISSAISNLMNDGGTVVQDLLTSSINKSKKDEAEAAFGKLYCDYMVNQNLTALEIYRSDDNTHNLDKTIDVLKRVTVTIPNEILEKNKSLRPDHLQSVYDHLRSQQHFDGLIPIKPFITGSKKIMDNIFNIIIEKFEWEIPDQYMKFISVLAYNWVYGYSISKILSDNIRINKDKYPKEKVSKIIRGCLEALETQIRFNLVRYFSAYIDILRVALRENGRKELENKIEPYHIFLEFGSYNPHALNLMALGLSRFTALYLQGEFDFPENVEAEEYLKQIHTMNIESFDMPVLCKQEVKDLIGA